MPWFTNGYKLIHFILNFPAKKEKDKLSSAIWEVFIDKYPVIAARAGEFIQA